MLCGQEMGQRASSALSLSVEHTVQFSSPLPGEGSLPLVLATGHGSAGAGAGAVSRRDGILSRRPQVSAEH